MDGLASARARLGKKDLAGAVVDLKSVLQKSPNLGEARFVLGTTLLRLGDAPGAIVELSKAAETGYDDDLVQPKLAWARLQAGRSVEVIKSTEKMELRNRSSQAELLAALSMAQSMQKLDVAARETIEKALAADAMSAPALSVKSRYLSAAGQIDEALSLLDRIPATVASERGEDFLLRGVILRFAKNDYAGAEKAFMAATAFSAQALPARMALIQLFLATRRLADAGKQLAELRKSHPKDPTTAYLEAVLAYASKEYVRADAVAEKLLKLAPDNAQLLLLGGAISLQRGQLLAAESRLGRVVHVERHARSARLLLADAYIRMGQPDKALGVLQPLTDGGRVDLLALPLFGQAALAMGRVDDAERFFASAAKANPQDIRSRTTLAMLDMARGKSQEAFAALDSLAEQDKGDTADLALVGTRLKRKEFELALQAIDRLQRKQPASPGPLHMRGVAMRAKGDLPGAREAYEKALQLDSTYFSSTAGLITLDLDQGNLEAARKRIDVAVAADPKNVVARMLLLDVVTRQGMPRAEILKLIDQAITAAPEDVRPRVAKITHLLAGKDVKAAAAAAQEAMASIPNHPTILDVGGQALAKAGDLQQALAAYGKWATLAPKSSGPYMRMADLHSQKGNSNAAIGVLVRGLEALPDSADIQGQLLTVARRLSDSDNLRAISRDLKSRYPKLAIGFTLEAIAAAAKKNWPVAISAHREGLSRSDPTGRNASLLFDAYTASGGLPAGKKFLDEWLALHQEDVALALHASSIALLKGDRDMAEQCLNKVVQRDPRHIQGLNNLAWLMAERKAAGAAAMAKRAIDLSPAAAPAWDTYAHALDSEGQMDKAIDAQRNAVRLMPARVQYAAKLIRLLAKSGKKVDARSELASLTQRAAGQLSKDDQAALDALVK